jgi:plastocyanin
MNTTSNATTTGNATTAAPTGGNVTGTNQTGGGETSASATDNTFRARGTINDFISSGTSGNTTTSNSTSDGYILGGRWSIDVIDGEVRRVQANISMAKPDGIDFHTHLIDNFTAGGGANETTTTTTANATGANVTSGGGNATTGNTTASNETVTLPQVVTGGSSNNTSNATTEPTGGNATAPGNETTTTTEVTLSQDGTFRISGTATIYTDSNPQWQNVPITIESTGRVLTINVDSERTDNHFMGQPIYGFVTGLIGSDNRSVLPPIEGAAPPTTPSAPNATAPTGNVTAPSNATAPTGNQTGGGNQTTTPSPAPNQTGGVSGGGGAIAVSITPGSSSKTTNAFDPNPVQAKVGDTVTWTNDDSTPHTVTSGSNGQPDGKFDSSPNLNPLMTPGQTFSHTFEQAGEYPYYCQLHPNMVGTVSIS